MSREIKFRAKVIEDFHTDSQICEAGEWVEGFYTKSLEGYDAICCQMQMECGGIGSGLVWVYIPIDINTLGEFTGLKDKNGKEVYEGDIIANGDTKPAILQVKFLEGGFCCTAEGILPIDLNCFYPSIGCRFEVIGNIYENPELLRCAK